MFIYLIVNDKSELNVLCTLGVQQCSTIHPLLYTPCDTYINDKYIDVQQQCSIGRILYSVHSLQYIKDKYCTATVLYGRTLFTLQS